MDIVFMDTTAQADKFLAKEQKKNKISQICAGKKVLSSTYVLGEFKANFLKDATTLYNLVYDSKNLGEALKRLEETYSNRITKRMCKLFGNIIKDVDDANDKEGVLDRLEIYIDDILVKRFKKGLDRILIDKTECLRSLAIPRKENNLWILSVGCTQKPKPQCRIEPFLLKEKIDELQKIEDLPQEMSKVENIVQLICKEEKKPFGNNCRTLGDVIIILESPVNSNILTSNIKDFKPICQCLNKDLTGY